MNVVAFILALAAAVVFAVETVRTRSLTCAGLCLLTVALIVQYIHPVADVHIH